MPMGGCNRSDRGVIPSLLNHQDQFKLTPNASTNNFRGRTLLEIVARILWVLTEWTCTHLSWLSRLTLVEVKYHSAFNAV
jgi:hypothetical protein